MRLILFACLNPSDVRASMTDFETKLKGKSGIRFNVSHRELIAENEKIMFRTPEQLIHMDGYRFYYVGASMLFKEYASMESIGFYKHLIRRAAANRKEDGKWDTRENIKIG